MSFSAPFKRAELMLLHQYVASPLFLPSVEWKQEGSANVLYDKQDIHSPTRKPAEPAICVIVGEVAEHKLYVSPVGNYNPTYNTLAASKFQLTLSRPVDLDFGPDFGTAVKNLETLQRATAFGEDCRFLILAEGNQESLRLSTPVFEMRVSQLTNLITSSLTTFSNTRQRPFLLVVSMIHYPFL